MTEQRNVKVITTKQFNYENFKEILEQIDGVKVYDKITSNIYETLEGTYIAQKEFYNNFLIVLDDYVGESISEDNKIFNLLSNALTGPDIEITIVLNRDAFNKYYERIAELGITNVYTPDLGSDTTNGDDVRAVFNRKFKMPKQWIAEYKGNKMDYIDASIKNKKEDKVIIKPSSTSHTQQLSVDEIDNGFEDLNDLFGSTVTSTKDPVIKDEKQKDNSKKEKANKIHPKKDEDTKDKSKQEISKNHENKSNNFNNKNKSERKNNIKKTLDKRKFEKDDIKNNESFNKNKGDNMNKKTNLEIHTFIKNENNNFLHQTMKKIIASTKGNKSNIYVILNGEYSTVSKTTSLDILDEFLKTQSSKSAQDLVFDSVTESGLGFDTISRLEGKGGVLTSINEILDILSVKYDNIFVIGDINAISNVKNHNRSFLYLDSKLDIYDMKDSLNDICNNLSNTITKNIKVELF